jgi:predicted MFS family arabinose efflux permease
LSGAGFSISFSIAGIIWGKYVGKVNRKNLIAMACMGWSLTNIVTGQVNSFTILVIMRALLGVA